MYPNSNSLDFRKMDIHYWTLIPWNCLLRCVAFFFPNTLKVKYTKDNEKAFHPSRRMDGSVGYDLFTPEDVIIHPLETKVIDTGIAIEMPHHIKGMILEKSSVAAKLPLHVRGGVIDPNYRGNIGVILWNHDPEKPYPLKAGMPIAQIVFSYAQFPMLVFSDTIDTDTIRGTQGGLFRE